MNSTIDEYISVKQYAQDHKISVQAVYQAINRNSIDFKRLGKVILVRP
jgi:predicted DNA-binding protein YlxM (UPF0122 family)